MNIFSKSSLWGMMALAACATPNTDTSERTAPQSDTAAPQASKEIKREKTHGPELPAMLSHYDALAGFVAGIDQDHDHLDTHEEHGAWLEYSSFITKSFDELEKKRLSLMRQWADTEFVSLRQNTHTVLYPFSGPDLLTAITFFPHAKRIIMIALEAPGDFPKVDTMQAENVVDYFGHVEESLSDIFNKSYFITGKMNQHLADNRVNGVLPLVSVFAKRTGHDLVDIARLKVNDDGTLEKWVFDENIGNERPVGLYARWRHRYTGEEKEWYYFSANLSNTGFKSSPEFLRYLNALDSVSVTYVKSASYLMHYNSFSQIRNLVLQKSAYILQDDTGIPYTHFDKHRWEIKLFGVYVKPVSDFSENLFQADLNEAYNFGNGIVQSLPFALGYHWGKGNDNLLLAKKTE